MGSRLVTVLLVSLAAACAPSASSETPPTPEPADETRASVPSIGYDNTVSQVLLQVGDYEFGNNLDQFVFGPRLVIYGDGSAFAEIRSGVVRNGAEVLRPIESRLSGVEIQTLLLAASKLPSVASAGEVPADGLPTLLSVNGQFWDILDFEVEPFNSYIDAVTATVTEAEIGPWIPAAWVQRLPPADGCMSVVEPEGAPYYSAPVYPHLTATYPLGPFTCR